MKKITITLIALLVSELSFAHGLTAGSYKGNGLWNSMSAKGTYQTSTGLVKHSHFPSTGHDGFFTEPLVWSHLLK